MAHSGMAGAGRKRTVCFRSEDAVLSAWALGAAGHHFRLFAMETLAPLALELAGRGERARDPRHLVRLTETGCSLRTMIAHTRSGTEAIGTSLTPSIIGSARPGGD